MKTLIVGGGIHGVTIALKLLNAGYEDFAIMDPADLTGQWQKLTTKINMGHLRSPVVHHIHPDPYDLKRYAKKEDYSQPFSGYYQRPQLEMFNNHMNNLIKEYQLENYHIREKAVSIEPGYIINGKHQAEQLILATGINHLHYIPEFMADVAHYQHLFDSSQPLASDIDVVIGGGITACHAVRELTKKRHVTLIMRHAIRTHELDSDPGWLGPRNMSAFNKIDDYKERRSIIKEARHRGSMPAHLKQSLKFLESEGRVTLIKGEVASADHQYLYLTDGRVIPYQSIALATGCEQAIAKDPLVSQIIQTFNPPLAPCGYPIVTHDLEWFDHVYVSGPLAELELGPVSRNIIGGRKASARICQAIS
ncbi:pyridine nucleotide-disulfide oxidoreductase [Macrococcus hajekii]|nr:NAD(P)-binding domain-containing protein [Macrococcus hajekii]GGB00418.1 pyridine nucleotide-disulfide oxidoreductase [Macrococcus hajekii]